ncbi:MAG: HupE/UreJ family protein [Sulfuricaulis sp.]|uniref:HupE/UreJ family protein n=1 Tax=Sulfuricaulis sp. TaxID=2003553 RepID=UPI0025F11A90|nr:HupE/UreJ family protein [Sulfuricaulis sp.]MCR4347108.1 HupE/UreJ family protein [Sulfuricaulis sp.]
MKRGYQIAAVLAALFLAGTAQAHTIGAHGAGFAAGMAHPFIGLDHLLAMVAVGIWAAQLGGRAIWRMPLAFMAMMALGSMFAFVGLLLPAVEAGIAVSVLVLGLLIAVAARFPLAASMLLVGAFALFHGHAHGQELPHAAYALLYSLGFLLATGLLHATGAVMGNLLSRGISTNWVRLMGGGIAAAGVMLVAV